MPKDALPGVARPPMYVRASSSKQVVSTWSTDVSMPSMDVTQPTVRTDGVGFVPVPGSITYIWVRWDLIAMVHTSVWLVIQSKRSEEHTSELQSRGHLVCRLLLVNNKRHPY